MPNDLYKEAVKNADDAAKYVTNIAEQFANIGLYKEDFKIGGKNEALFFNQSIQTTVGGDPNPFGGELQVGAYTNTKFDLTTTEEMVENVARDQFRDTDANQGSSQVKKISSVTGLTALAESARDADTRVKLYDRDSGEVASINDVLAKQSSSQGRIYATEVTGNSFHQDLKNNMSMIDDALKERGINAKNLTIKDIDQMIGGSGKHSYGRQQSHFHSGTSRVFTGETRDQISGAKDRVFGRNTGWAGREDRGGVYITEDTATLLKEKRRLREIEEKGANKGEAGVKGVAKAWASAAIEDTDAGAGLSNVKSIVVTSKAVVFVGTAANAGLQSLGVQGMAAVQRAGIAIGKGAYNLGGNIYSLGNANRRAKWEVHRSRTNARLNARSSVIKENAAAKQKLINEKTKNRIEFLRKSGWEKTKVVGGAIGRGGKWVATKIGNTAAGQVMIAGATRFFAPFRNIFAAPFGRLTRFFGNIWSNANSALIAFRTFRNNLAQRFAASTIGKIFRAPFSALNWINIQLKKVIAAVIVGFLMLVAADIILLGAGTLLAALIPSTESVSAAITAIEQTEKTFTDSLIDYYTNDAIVQNGEMRCDKCTKKAGYADCATCDATGIVKCSTCNATGISYKDCKGCNGKGYLISGSAQSARVTGCTKCQGKGYKISDRTGETSYGYVKGTGLTKIKCPTCKGQRNWKCPQCEGDGARDTTCKNCNGKGKVPKITNCTHKSAVLQLDVAHSVVYKYTGATTVSYSNLGKNVTKGEVFKYTTGANYRYDKKYMYKAVMSMGLIATQGTQNTQLYESYCDIMINKMLHEAKISHTVGSHDGVITVEVKHTGLTDLMKLEKKVVKCDIPGCCGKTFPKIDNSWINSQDDTLEWDGWNDTRNFSDAVTWYESSVNEWKNMGIELPSIFTN